MNLIQWGGGGALCLFLASCGICSGVAEIDPKGIYAHWDSSKVYFSIHKNTDHDRKTILACAEKWNGRAHVKLLPKSVTDHLHISTDTINSVFYGSLSSINDVAYSHRRIRADSILTDVDVEIDEDNMKHNRCTLERTLVHEFGHILGLYHETFVKESVMREGCDESETRYETPMNHDIKNLCKRYWRKDK